MQANDEVIRRFFRALMQRNWESLQECYHAKVRFTDEVFDLSGSNAVAMWRMLCAETRDLQIKVDLVSANASTGQARWQMRYVAGQNGRSVRKIIESSFEFRGGQIVRHTDRFDFWKWASQALGASGRLLGWSRLLRKKVRSKATRQLAEFADALGRQRE